MQLDKTYHISSFKSQTGYERDQAGGAGSILKSGVCARTKILNFIYTVLHCAARSNRRGDAARQVGRWLPVLAP